MTPLTGTQMDQIIGRVRSIAKNYGDFENEIYAQGMLGGHVPAITTDVAALEQVAASALSKTAFDYIVGAAGTGATARANLEAFDRRRIVQRMLTGTDRRTYDSTVLGTHMPAPLIIAPMGVQTLAHPDGELATARAAAALELTYIHSTQASHTFEEVAAASGDGSRWYQLYWSNDRAIRESFLHRAKIAGYTTLVLTVDTTTVSWRPRDLDNGFLPFLAQQGVANYFSDPAFLAGLAKTVEDDPLAAALHFSEVYSDPTLSWDDLPFLRDHWEGPITLKGIVAVEDARRAIDSGVDGLIVSNHGGRQVDGAIAALDALDHIAAAVGDDITVLFDSGIRSGADIVKALALGARAVLIGRPVLFGLGLGGRDGVEHVLRCLLAEMDLTIALSGYASHRDLRPDMITLR